MVMMEISNSHVIDIDGLDCWPRGDIYRKKKGFPVIQKIQRTKGDIDKNAYEPYIVSIGPYHHESPNVKVTEQMKCDCLSYMLELNQAVTLSNYVEAVRGLEKQVRSCYTDDILMDKKTFVQMLLLDGCFLINTLRGLDGMVPHTMNSDISKEKATMSMDEDNTERVIDIDQSTQVDSSNEKFTHFARILSRDLLLSENQIPFFVITKIYEIMGGSSASSLLKENIVGAMEAVLNCYPKANREYDRPIEIYHLLHLCHIYFKPSIDEKTQSCQNQPTRPSSFHHFLQLGSKFFRKNNQELSNGHVYGSQPLNHWLRATEYNEAKLELKKRECCHDDPHSLLDITFCNGTLKIPCLTILQETYDLFRNLVAFEQTHPQFGNYMTSYVVFWSHFAATPDDVSLLVQKGIIRHHSHSYKEVSDFLKSLDDGIVLDFNGEYYLKSVCHMTKGHYQIWRPRWRKWLGSVTSSILNFSQMTMPKTTSEL